MADSLTELLQAVDTYMASNAKNKTAGPYLATKLAAVFEDPNSIFNPSGIVKTIGDKLSKTFADMDAELNTFKKSLTDINKTNISSIFAKSMNSLVGFSSSLGKFNTKLYDAGKILPKLTTNSIDTVLSAFSKKIANLNTINLYTSFSSLAQTLNIFDKKIKKMNISDLDKSFMSLADTLMSLTDILNIAGKNVNSGKGLNNRGSGYVIPASLTAPPRERTLESHDIVDVNIVKVNDNVASRLGKYDKKGGMFNNFFGNQDSFRSDSRNGARGFMGKIFDWIKSILFWGLAIFGGAFLLGKIKKFLDETPLGQKIKADIKAFGSMLFKKITDYLNTGDLGKTIANGIKFAMNILRKVIQKGFDLIDANKNAVKGIVNDIWNTVRDEIVMPLYDTFIHPFFEWLENKVKTIDWSNAMGDIGKWIKEKVIDPIWNSIADDFKNNDSEEGWAKILGLGALAAIIIGPTGLIFLFSSLVSVITSTVGLFGSLIGLIGAPGVGLIAALTSFMYLLNSGKENQQKLKEQLPHIQKQLTSIEDSVREKEQQKLENAAQIKQVEQLPDSTYKMLKLQELENERKINNLELEKEKLLKEAKQSGLEAREDLSKLPWYKVFTMPGLIGFIGNKIKASKAADKEVEAQTKHNSELLRLTKEQTEIMADQKLLQEEQAKTKNTFIPPRTDVIPIKDGIVSVSPDKHDQGVVFGKENGPFSLSNKETMKKLDTLTQVFAEGVSLIMQASVQGSQQIVGAIASTSKGASQATTGGGMDNVGAYRDRVARALNG